MATGTIITPAQALRRMDQAAAKWDKAFRDWKTDPTDMNLKKYQAASQAYKATQRLYQTAVMVSMVKIAYLL
jgi:hypothetical protein